MDILLVENDHAEAELTTLALRRAGFAGKLVHAEDGFEAFRLLGMEGGQAPRLPSLILLDVNMPKINGLEVLSRLKADERVKPIPVVMVSSSERTSDHDEAHRLGATRFVVKPVEFDRFLDAIASLAEFWAPSGAGA